MAVGQDKRSPLITQRDELIKSYTTYDGNGLPEYVYTANTDAGNGGVCTRVQYTYVTGTTRVEKMKETIASWDSSWDI